MDSGGKFVASMIMLALVIALYAVYSGELLLACAIMLAAMFLPAIMQVPVYGMLTLLALQFVLLGSSSDFVNTKFVYAALFVGCMALWFPKYLAALRMYLREPIIYWSLILFIVCGASLVQGRIHGIPTADWIRDFNPLVNYIWIIPAMVGFSSLGDVRKKLILVTGAGVILTIIAANVYAVMRGFTSFLLPGVETFLRDPDNPLFAVQGTIADSWMLFAVFIPLSLASVRYRERRSAKLFMIVTAIGAAATVLTGTRSSLIAIAGGIAFLAAMALLQRKGMAQTKQLRAFAVVVALSALLLFGLSVAGYIDANSMLDRMQLGREVFADQSMSNRFTETRDAYLAFADSPWFGQGLGYRLPTVFQTGVVGIAENFFFVHNFYMWVLCKFGIIGVIVWAGFLGSVFLTALKGFRKATDPFEREFCGGMAAWLVSLAIQSITSARFNDRGATALLGMTIGMMLALKYRTWNATPQPLPIPLSRPGTAPVPSHALIHRGVV